MLAPTADPIFQLGQALNHIIEIIIITVGLLTQCFRCTPGANEEIFSKPQDSGPGGPRIDFCQFN